MEAYYLTSVFIYYRVVEECRNDFLKCSLGQMSSAASVVHYPVQQVIEMFIKNNERERYTNLNTQLRLHISEAQRTMHVVWPRVLTCKRLK